MKLFPYIMAADGSLSAFAKRAGIPMSTLSRIANGETGVTLRTANLIVQASHTKPTPSGGVVTFEELLPSENAA